MNYRHAFHAGNFADVAKHVALVAVLLHLRRKEKPFCVIDTHAGRGLYDLGGMEAARTAEAAGGIARLGGIDNDAQTPESLRSYLDCVRQEGRWRYPGSARIAARLLRPQDRLIAIEKHPEEAAALRVALAEFCHARAVEADGYESLSALLPPRERRGAILVDPPFEDENEFARAAELLTAGHRRFGTGIYLAWHPLKSRGAADAFCGELRAGGISKLLRLEIEIGAAPTGATRSLSSAGLVIVNPPFGFDDEMRSAAAILAPRLGRTADRPARITLLSRFP